MADLFNKVLELIQQWRYSPYALPITFLAIFTGVLYAPLPDGISLSIQFRIAYGTLAGILGTIGIWIYQQPPKIKNNSVGILIAIRTEDDKIKRRISKDFIGQCKKLLESSHSETPFQILELNDYYSSLATNHDSAVNLRNRCAGHLLIYGDVVQRQEHKKQVYALRLEGLVCHAPIDLNNQSLLAEEMRAVLPLKNLILEENELSGFEVTSMQLAEATKYVIATAALLSNDYNLAINLLEEIKTNKNNKAFRKLLNIASHRLGHAYQFASMIHFNRWENLRNEDEFKSSIHWISKYNQLNPKDDRHFLLLKAIEHFVFERDINAAMQCISQCKSKYIIDPAWKYSAAFLEAYRNNLDKAKQYYDAALATEAGHDLPFQIEGFIAWILEIEPDKTQLYFCLGYINEMFKSDIRSAQGYYEKFLSSSPDSRTSGLAIEHAQISFKK